ncbi:MAG: TolC family protein [Nitrospirae bacterium]|nr:TolC family protein [Nitrospirota bacterium]
MNKSGLRAFFFFMIILTAQGKAFGNDVWTLQSCIDYALKNSPELQSAEAKIKTSGHGLDYQKALFLPRLDLNASTGYLHGDPVSPIAIVRNITDEGIKAGDSSGQYISAGLTLTAPIIREGAIFAKNAPSVNMAAQQVSVDKSSYAAKKNEVIFGIGNSFFSVLRNNEDIKAAEEHLKSLKHAHDTAKSKFREGLLSKNDLLISEVKLASGEKERLIFINQARLLMTDLTVKMGLDPTKSIPVSDGDFVLPELNSVERLIETAIAGRFEIMAQEARTAMAKEALKLTENQKYPTVDFVSSFAVANDYGSRNNALWIGGIQVNVPLFDFGGIKSKAEGQKMKVLDEEQYLVSLKRQIAQEVITAYTNIQNIRADISLREKIVEQSAENARLVRAQFNQNMVPLPLALNAEYDLYQQKKALVQSRYDLRNAYLNMVKSIGGSSITSLQK